MGQTIAFNSTKIKLPESSCDDCLCLTSCLPLPWRIQKCRRPRARLHTRAGPLKQLLHRLPYPHAVSFRNSEGSLADSFSVELVLWSLVQEFLGGPPPLLVATFEDDPWTYNHTVKVSHKRPGQGLQSSTLVGHNDIILSVFMDGNAIITGSYDETAMIWDAVNGNWKLTLACGSPVFAVAMQNGVAITGTMGGITQVWDVYKINGSMVSGPIFPTFKIDGSPFRWSLERHSGPVLALGHRGSTVVTGSADATARVWDIYRGQCCHILRGHTGRIEAVAVHPNLQLVVTGSTDGTTILWNRCTGESLHVLPVDAECFPTSNFLPKFLAQYMHNMDSVVAVALNGDKIAAVSAHGKIRIWNRRSGKMILQDDGSSLIPRRQGLRGGIDMDEKGTLVVCWKEGCATIWDSKISTPQFVLTSGFMAGHTGNYKHAVCRAWLDREQ